MKRIDEAMVRHMAQLSRLSLTDDEVTIYTEQLANILEYASHLPELDSHTESLSLRVAEDIERDKASGSDLLRNAIATENGYVKVPAILDRSES